MVTLCIDTCHKFLTLAIIKDGELFDAYNHECPKKQSETVFIELKKLFNKHHLSVDDIEKVCVTNGPGSYTGIRIGLTIAKTLCSFKNIPLYTISSLCLYANNEANTMVLLDARSKRAYCGIYDLSDALISDTVKPLIDINTDGYNLVGDLSLIGKSDFYYFTPSAFVDTQKAWIKVDNIDTVVPVYLKETSEYFND